MLQETLWGAPEPIEDYPQEKVETKQEKQRTAVDPRPDLAYDSDLWVKLLELAEKKDRMLAGTLHGFRCGGLRLHRSSKWYSLRPDFDPNISIWTSQAEYEADRDKWLIPYKDQVAGLLRQLVMN